MACDYDSTLKQIDKLIDDAAKGRVHKDLTEGNKQELKGALVKELNRLKVVKEVKDTMSSEAEDREILRLLATVDTSRIVGKQTKDSEWVMRNGKPNFGNPFYTAEPKNPIAGDMLVNGNNKATLLYYKWLKNDELPEGANREALNKRRGVILNNLHRIKNAKALFYKGTARGNKINHVTALIAISEDGTPSQGGGNSSTPVLNTLPEYRAGQKNMTYAGIGNTYDETHGINFTDKFAKIATEVATELESLGYTLNSGGADGADTAFEMGVTRGNKQIIMPWPSAKRDSAIEDKSKDIIFFDLHDELKDKARAVAKEVHPRGDTIHPVTMEFMAGNIMQVLGPNLDTPVDFVLYHAKDTKGSNRPDGGTGQAVEIARIKGIPTINIMDSDWKDQLNAAVKQAKSSTQGQGEVLIQGWITVDDTRENRDRVYLFGDNTDSRVNKRASRGEPTGGRVHSSQAEIRGEPNALGIDTKKGYTRGDKGNAEDYFTPSDLPYYKGYLDGVFNKIAKLQKEGKTIVLPKAGIGTGRARLKENAPQLYNELATRLNRLANMEYMQLVPVNQDGTGLVVNTLSGGDSVKVKHNFVGNIDEIESKLNKFFTKPKFKVGSNKDNHAAIVMGTEKTKNVPYEYYGNKHPAGQIMPEWIKTMLEDIGELEQVGKDYYNHVLVNKFTGTDISTHQDGGLWGKKGLSMSDAEKKEYIYSEVDKKGNLLTEEAKAGSVAVVSIGSTVENHRFGETRNKVNNKNYSGDDVISVSAPSGSLVVMSTGEIWHYVPKANGVRYSITPRHIPQSQVDYHNGKVTNSQEDVVGSDEGNSFDGVEATEVYTTTEETSVRDLYEQFVDLDYSEEDNAPYMPYVSPEFAEHAEGLADSYTELLADADKSNLKVEFFDKSEGMTTGDYNLKTKGIRLGWNKMSRTAKAGEVFLHEVTHRVAKDVFAVRPDLLNRAEELRDAVIDLGVDHTIFLQDAPNPTKEEVGIAKSKFRYVFDKTSSDPEEFYSYATSNDQVWTAIQSTALNNKKLIKNIEPKKITKVVNGVEISKTDGVAKLLNALIDQVNSAWRTMTGRGGNGGEQLANLMMDVAAQFKEMEDVKLERGMFDDVKSVQKLSNYKNSLDNYLVRQADDAELKLIALGKKPSTQKFKKFISTAPVLKRLVENSTVRWLVTTITTDTTATKFKDMYAIFRISKNAIEKQTNSEKTQLKIMLDDEYKDLDNTQKEAIKQVLFKADGRLLEEDELETLLQGDNLAKAISEDFKDLADDGKEHLFDQIQGLADFLITGTSKTHNQQLNANNIVGEFFNRPQLIAKTGTDDEYLAIKKKRADLYQKTGTLLKDARTIANVDRLVTLLAIQNIDKESKESLRELLKTKDGKSIVAKSNKQYSAYMDTLHKESDYGQFIEIKKGYTRAEEGPIKYKLVPESEVKAELNANMALVDGKSPKQWYFKEKEVGGYVKSTKEYVTVEGIKYYMMVGRIPQVGLSEGALGLISNTMEGISLSSLVRKNNEIRGSKALDEEKLRYKSKNIVFGFSTGINNKVRSANTLVPVTNSLGEITDYRLPMSVKSKSAELAEKSDLEDLLSTTYSRSIKTELTSSFNKEVVDTIIANANELLLKDPDNFVVLEEYTDEMKTKGIERTELHDRWDILPPATKRYVTDKRGLNGLAVHRDYVGLMTGERDKTIANWTLGVDLRRYPEARLRLAAFEGYIKEVLALFKTAMIKLNGEVIKGNMLSNGYVAGLHGIDPLTYSKEFKTGWQRLNRYVEIDRKISAIKVKQRSGEKGLEPKIKALDKQLAKDFALDLLVKNGQFSVIAEDINTEDTPKGRLEELLEETIDKTGKFSAPIRGLKNVLFIDNNSKLGKFATKNVTYQDTITRIIILEKLLEETRVLRGLESVRDIPAEDIERLLNYTDQLLVNYGYTMDPNVSYSEKVLGLLYLRYYLAQGKAIVATARRKPTNTIIGEGSQIATGLTLNTPSGTYTSGPVEGLVNRMLLPEAPGEVATPNIVNIIPNFTIFR